MSSSVPLLKSITLAARSAHTATVIFVHGLGDTGEGWEPVAKMFGQDPGLSHVKWVLPHAPVMPVTANLGIHMPSWFDIYSFGFDCAEDENGMLTSVHNLNALISAEVDAGIPASRIILGGFSQGGAMSLLTGLTTERKLAGVVALSSWLPLNAKFSSMTTEHARQVPIFWGHGQSDPLVKYSFATTSVEYLKTKVGIRDAPSMNTDAKPTGLLFRSYAGLAHSASEKELDDLRTWLRAVVPQSE